MTNEELCNAFLGSMFMAEMGSALLIYAWSVSTAYRRRRTVLAGLTLILAGTHQGYSIHMEPRIIALSIFVGACAAGFAAICSASGGGDTF